MLVKLEENCVDIALLLEKPVDMTLELCAQRVDLILQALLVGTAGF